MQPFSHAISEPDRLTRMVGLSAAVHLALIAGLVLADRLAPAPIDFRDAIQVTLVPPSAPEAQPRQSPDQPPPAPPLPKSPPPPPPAQARRDPVLAPLEDDPLWDKLSEDAPGESELARQFREMERARPQVKPPPESAELEEWWDRMMATAPQPTPEAPVEASPETPDTPSLSEAFEQLRAEEKAPEAPELIATGELTQWLDAQIGMVLSPGDVSADRVSDVDRYIALVKSKVESHWSPPDLFRGSGAKALLTFVIERDGRVSDIRVARTSGSLHFDEAAMRALLTAGPFPPLPEAVKSPAAQVNYLFEFEPRGGP